MGAGNLGRNVVVVVDTSRKSEAAFQRALQELGTDDSLIIVFARPYRHGDGDWERTTGPAQKTFDKHSRQVLAKYSALATQANVHFEAMEVEGHHAVDAIALKCAEVNADLLIKPEQSAKQMLQRAFRGSGGDMCRYCNPYLRSTGRIIPMRPIGHKEGQQELPCPLLVVARSGDQLTQYGPIGGQQTGGYAVLSAAA